MFEPETIHYILIYLAILNWEINFIYLNLLFLPFYIEAIIYTYNGWGEFNHRFDIIRGIVYVIFILATIRNCAVILSIWLNKL